ncbi:MAG: hypothetical protein V8R30_06455 [Clostridia bacterium]|jgi:hypothetical protein
MGKRKNDKLETMYQNIDLKFKDASEEEIREEIARGNLQIEENNNEIEKLKETIKTKQQLIEALEGKDESETSPRIQKAIEDASKELEEAQNKLKDYELKILEIKNGETNLISYSKNKNQIKQIRTFKESIAKKLPVEIAKRDDSKAKMEAAEESLRDANAKLANEKLTMEMDQYEYNALLEQKAQAEKDVKEQTEIYKKAKDRILELQTKIGKCDLAWKTLFTGKSWDEIQRRALDPNTKFTRHIDEDTKLNRKSGIKEDKLINNIAKTVDEVRNEQEDQITNDENADLPVPTSKHPRWEKFKNFFKNAGRKLKELFVGEEPEQEEVDISEMKNIPQEKRDQFLEELRRHVDKEYGKEIRDQKEAMYTEQHKAKAKESEPQEKDER